MIYITASGQIVQTPMIGRRESEEACFDCMTRVSRRRRPSEAVLCYHVLHRLRRPLQRAPQRVLICGWG